MRLYGSQPSAHCLKADDRRAGNHEFEHCRKARRNSHPAIARRFRLTFPFLPMSLALAKIGRIMRFLGFILALVAPAAAETLSGKPRIVDGDTIEIGVTSVRLHGIDAPEVAQPCGRDAVAAIAALIADKDITCDGSKLDDFGRLIANAATMI